MNGVELSVVILNFNTKKLLLDCLKSLETELKYASFKVYVVDNASTDGSVQAIKKEQWKFPLTVIENGKNLGFAAGNNIALKKIESPFTLILNPDTKVLNRSIDAPLTYLKSHNNVGAVTCKVELANGVLDYSCHRGFPTPWNSLCYFSGLSRLFPNVKLFSGYTLSYRGYDTAHEIEALTGAYALIRTEIGKQLGWFDEDYFWNGEDIDLCYRIIKAGYKIYYLPDTKIIHYKGSASGLKTKNNKSISSENKQIVSQSTTKVMKIFFDKHLANQYPSWFRVFVHKGIDLLAWWRSKHI